MTDTEAATTGQGHRRSKEGPVHQLALLISCDKTQEQLKKARVHFGSWSKRDAVHPVGKGTDAGA